MKFRRQHPIGGYILDFYCERAALAVEIDGGGHGETDKMSDDSRRTETLRRLGIRVIRFWNTDVLQNLDGVLERMLREMKAAPSP